jgi:hypothetical protein
LACAFCDRFDDPEESLEDDEVRAIVLTTMVQMKAQLFKPFLIVKADRDDVSIVNCQMLMKDSIVVCWFVRNFSSQVRILGYL